MRRSTFFFFLFMVVLFIAACGGGDDDDERPTDRAFPTVTPIITTIPRVASPTPLPTFDRGPSPTAFAGFPTFQAPPTQGVVVQQNIQIVSPITGATVSGNVSIFGSASHPQFVQYTVEWGPASNPNNLWYPITPQAITVPVVNGVLASWNTNTVPDGTYQIRLHVYLSNNTEITNAVVSNIRVRNNVPTNTPQAVNNSPTISPIASFSLLEGTAATLAVGVFDQDGDPLVISASTDNPGVATVSQSGQSITVRAVSQGVATITVHVSDGRGGNTSTRFVVTVTQARQDNPPSIQAVPGQTLAQGSTISVPLTITDPDGDAVTFTAASGNTALLDVTTVNEPRSVRLTAKQPGTTSVRITASDTQGRQATSLFTVVINPRIETNNPPSIGAITSQTIDEGQTRVVNISVSDPDNDTLTVNSSVSNEGIVSILQLTQTFLTLRGDNAGTSVVTLTVRDGRGGSSSTTFSVTVNVPPPPNQPPSIGPIDPRTVAVGQSLTVDLTLSDPDSDELTTAAISTDPQVVTVGMVDSDTLRITGVRAGDAAIQIAVGDGSGGSAVAGFDVTVVESVEPNNPPDITGIDAQTLTVGESLVIGLTVTDPDDDPIAVTVMSSNPSIASIFQNNPDEVTIVGNSVGSTSLTVAVDDGRGGSDATTFTVTVQPQANNPPVVENIDPVVCNPGASSTVDVVFSDPDGDDVGFASVTSEDETIAVVNVLDGGRLEVICAAPGITTITVSISDGIDTTDVIFQVVVVAPTATATSVDAPTATSVPPTQTPIPTDASTPTPTFTVFPSVTPIPPTEIVPTATFTDIPPSPTETFTEVVPTEAPNQEPVIEPIDDQTVNVGETLPVEVNVTDPDDDELTVSAQSDTPEIAIVSMDEMTMNIFGVEVGTAEIMVTVTDDSGATATVDFTVTVIGPTATFTEIPPTEEENQDPVIASIPDQTVEVGQTISGEINVSDPDDDELTITAESDRPARATVSVDGTIISIEGISAGNATITIQADDGRGGTATTSFDVSVVAPTDTPVPATDTPTEVLPTATFTEIPPTE
ncbi:MAG: pilus assembly protein N-terminal domain-containing protein, partial [Chloroflexi bacterium]|nr:pilus assembly protein N-terminal domain-containing protein [Chloroflexota bacterium]